MASLFPFTIIIFMNIFSAMGNQNILAPTDDKAPIDSVFDMQLTTGLDYVLQSRFVEAITLFNKLEKQFPNHPAPNFYKVAVYQSWMLTYRFNAFQEELINNTELTIEKGRRLLEKNNDPWLNFYVGGAYGYRALHLFRQHNWISAYFDSEAGINNFLTALEKWPNLYDCYYGLGVYNYWRTAKSKFLSFLMFWMKDKRQLGLQQLEISIKKGRYCPVDATHGLIIAYYDYGDYSRALEFNKRAMKICDPPSLPALYMHGRLMAIFGKWPDVQSTFQEILKRLVVQPYQSISYMVECKYWIAKALKKQSRLKEANKLVIQALVQSKNWIKEKELENPFEDFDTIIDMLNQLHESLEKNIVQ